MNKLLKLTKKELLIILKEIPNNTFLAAFSDAPDEIKEHVFSALTRRARDLVEEDIAECDASPVEVSNAHVLIEKLVDAVLNSNLRQKQ